ncbi:MAG: DUF6499 domain-containing protein [Sphingobium limneticum]
MSPVDDGRADGAAPISDDLDLPGLAFEFLRRNPRYVADASRRPDEKSTGNADDLARQWGLRFRP